MCVCAKSLQLCPTLCDPVDCSLPGSSVHGIFQARILEWAANSFSRGSSKPTNATHFTKHMNKMIEAMDIPEASIASLWETSTSSPWWKTILITIILIVLFLLFAPCICNCITGIVSSRMGAFKLQMVAQSPATAAASSIYYLGPLDQKPSIRGLGECVISPI